MPRYRPAIALACTFALNAMFWAIALSSFPFPLPPGRIFAEFLSTSALIILSTNLLLATRARPLEDLFVGLDRVFVSHRFNGITAAIVLAAHFTIMPKTPGWTPARLVGLPTLTLIIIVVLVAVAPRAPWRRLVTLRYQHWKFTHRFNGLLVAAGVTHSLLAHPVVLALPLMRVWVYGVAGTGLLAYAFHETLEPWLVQRHRYRVGEPVHLGGDVLEIRLAGETRPIAHRGGQFAFVSFDDGPAREQHPFTISAAPTDGSLRFSIKASGDFTQALQGRLSAGSIARIEGPYGRFELARGGRRQLWLAGGIGITPFLAMLPGVPDDCEVHLVWTVPFESDAIYRDEIERTVATHPSTTFTLHATRVAGHLDLANLGIAEPADLSVFVCGPKPMRDAFIVQLRALGVRRARIFYEEFSLR